MKKIWLIVSMLSVCLAGCDNQTREVTYEEFCQRAIEFEEKFELPDARLAHYFGVINDEKVDFICDFTQYYPYSLYDNSYYSFTQNYVRFIMGSYGSWHLYNKEKDDNATYYIGREFIIKDKNSESRWDKYQRRTYYCENRIELRVKYYAFD